MDLEETREKILALGSGDGIPDPEELSDEEEKEYRKLKKHYIELKNIKGAKDELDKIK